MRKFFYVVDHKVHIYLEYNSECPLVGIGTPTPFPASECSPPPQTKGGGAHSPAVERAGESQFRRMEKRRLALCLLCVFDLLPFLICRLPPSFYKIWSSSDAGFLPVIAGIFFLSFHF
jgi:hypothetical protein